MTAQIVPVRSTNGEPLYTTFDPHGRPSIGGDPFPWAIDGDAGITFTASRKHMPILKLTFIAEHVDADVDIPEEENQP